MYALVSALAIRRPGYGKYCPIGDSSQFDACSAPKSVQNATLSRSARLPNSAGAAAAESCRSERPLAGILASLRCGTPTAFRTRRNIARHRPAQQA